MTTTDTVPTTDWDHQPVRLALAELDNIYAQLLNGDNLIASRLRQIICWAKSTLIMLPSPPADLPPLRDGDSWDSPRGLVAVIMLYLEASGAIAPTEHDQ